VAGQIVSVSGKVSARDETDAKTAASERPLSKVGQDVYVGDAIHTFDNGQIKLLMKDHSILDLAAKTLVRLTQLSHPADADRDVHIDLEYGEMRGAVTRKLMEKSKFVIRTRTAVMGVRGTELVVKADAKDRTELTVLQGKVAVQPSGLALKPGAAPPFPTYVSAGRQIVVETVPQQANVFVPPPTVSTLQPQRVSEIARSVHVEDTVLRSALTYDTHQSAVTVTSETTSISRSPAANLPAVTPATISGTQMGALGGGALAGGPFAGPPPINPRAGTNPTVTVTVVHP
jgi:hypothetical protein